MEALGNLLRWEAQSVEDLGQWRIQDKNKAAKRSRDEHTGRWGGSPGPGQVGDQACPPAAQDSFDCGPMQIGKLSENTAHAVRGPFPSSPAVGRVSVFYVMPKSSSSRAAQRSPKMGHPGLKEQGRHSRWRVGQTQRGEKVSVCVTSWALLPRQKSSFTDMMVRVYLLVRFPPVIM